MRWLLLGSTGSLAPDSLKVVVNVVSWSFLEVVTSVEPILSLSVELVEGPFQLDLLQDRSCSV